MQYSKQIQHLLEETKNNILRAIETTMAFTGIVVFPPIAFSRYFSIMICL